MKKCCERARISLGPGAHHAPDRKGAISKNTEIGGIGDKAVT